MKKEKVRYDYISFGVRIFIFIFIIGVMFNTYRQHQELNEKLKRINPEFETNNVDWVTISIMAFMFLPALVFIGVDIKDRKRIHKTNQILERFSRSLGFQTYTNTFQRILMPKKIMLKGNYNRYDIKISSIDSGANYLPVKFLSFHFMIMLKSSTMFLKTLFIWQDKKGLNTKSINPHISGQKIENLSPTYFSDLPSLPQNCLLQFVNDGYIIYTDEIDITKIKQIIDLSIKYAEKLK